MGDDEQRGEENTGPGDVGIGDEVRVALLDAFEVLLGIMNCRHRAECLRAN